MYNRFSTLFLIAVLTAVATAVPNALEAREAPPKCDAGELLCCKGTETSNPTTLDNLGGQLGMVLPSVEGLIGLGCTPITVVGTGSGAMCTAQPVCCTKNDFNGLVNLGCTPVNLSL